MDIEEVARQIVDAAIKVHRALGPGLLESAYQKCLAYELRKRGLRVECEVLQPVIYEDVRIDAGYRIDMLVEDCVIIENKTVEKLRSSNGLCQICRKADFFHPEASPLSP